MWQRITDANALFRVAKTNDYLFCSVFEDGLDRDWNGALVFIITTIAADYVLLTSISSGQHFLITYKQFRDKYWWYLQTPALTQGVSNVHSKIILAAENKYDAVLDAGIKNYPFRPANLY